MIQKLFGCYIKRYLELLISLDLVITNGIAVFRTRVLAVLFVYRFLASLVIMFGFFISFLGGKAS